MKKITKGLGVLTTTILMLAFTGQAGAFCVHNKSDRTMIFEQSSGGKTAKSYSGRLNLGEDGCCHWSNTDCNKSGDKDASLGFNVGYYGMGGAVIPSYVCKGEKIPACSDLDVTGSNGNYQCVAHGMETCN